MKVGLIPPIVELGSYKETGFHLLLSHLLSDERYYEYYHKRRNNHGDYLVLDNSAHEHGIGNKIEELLGQALGLRAQEIVVPDVLFDRHGTLQGARSTLAYLRTPQGSEFYHACKRPVLMFVPQGDGRKEWRDCLFQLMALWEQHLQKSGQHAGVPFTIGISKDYDVHRGGLLGLVETVASFKKKFPQMNVHCLGWPNDLWSIAKVARKHPWVRSVDSAKSFVYAKNGVTLEPGGRIPLYPRRDENYFTEEFTGAQRACARRNVEVFVAAATDNLIIEDD